MTPTNHQKKTKAALQRELETLRNTVRRLERQLAKTSPDLSFPDEHALDALVNPDLIPLFTWTYHLTTGKFECPEPTALLINLKANREVYSLNDYLDTVYTSDQRMLLSNLEKLSSHDFFFKQLVRHREGNDSYIPTLTAAYKATHKENEEYLLGVILDLRPFYRGRDIKPEEKYQYHRLFELSPSGIIIEDHAGKILDANPSFCLALGYKLEDLIGQQVHILAHPEVREQVNQNIAQLLAGETLKHNVKSLRKDGSLCYMELSETKILLPNGEEGILCIAEDFTQRVKAQHENLQREKLEGILEMAGAVCHEINQPLTTIFITTDMLLDFPKPENLRDIISVIKDEAIRIGKITDKLMKITKYETRDYIPGKKIFDLDKSTSSDL